MNLLLNLLLVNPHPIHIEQQDYLKYNVDIRLVIIKEIDENGQSPVILNQIRLQKQSPRTDGAEAVRQYAYYNLLLWDLLVSQLTKPPAEAI